MTSRTYPPPGCCIYCGAQGCDLTDEHIVPYGLAGDWLIFAKASCKACARITGATEQAVLRRTLGAFRYKIESPTRRKRDRKQTRTVGVGVRGTAGSFEDSGERRELPAADLPMAYIALELSPPGILLGEPPSSEVKGRVVTWLSGRDGISKLNAGEGFHLGSIDPQSFCQMLAKIAYSYAVAEMGADAFVPAILPLVLGKSNTPGHWVGGAPDEPPTSETFSLRCAFATIRSEQYLVVHVRLYGELGTPGYFVVVGELKPTPHGTTGS